MDGLPHNIDELIQLSRDKTNYKNRLKAVDGLGKWKCRQSIDKLWRLMISDKVYSVQRQAFLKLQQFGEKVRLPKKKKGHLVKDINKKLITVHKKFNSSNYTINDFKKKFQEIYPEIFDIYSYEKGHKMDTWIQTVIQHSPKKKIKNIYNIIIEFKNHVEPQEIILKNKFPYHGFVNELDEVQISANKIFIKAERSGIYHPKNILNNEANTIHIQIIKTLIVYYLCIQKPIGISSIKIIREKTKLLDEYVIPNKDEELSQVLSSDFQIPYVCKLSSNELACLFGTDEKAITLFNASSYILKALATTEASSRFEKLWRAFNSIYRYIGQSKNENDCHIRMRQFLLDNSAAFSASMSRVAKITKDELRDKIRFRDLILNDYETKELTVSFIAFIYRYTDKRISQILLETLVYREEFLKDVLSINNVESKFNKFDSIRDLYRNTMGRHKEYIYEQVVNYLDTQINNNNANEMELMVFICIKYGYYVRNKIFHAEKHDLSFRFIKNKQIEELDWLNDVLATLLLELIKNNSIWQKFITPLP